MSGHKIREVIPGSIAWELGIEAGDVLLSVNGKTMEDAFDYHYLVNEEEVVLLIEKGEGEAAKEQWELEIEKEYEEDLGIVFEQDLMDEYHSCRNKCMFCFIDQMPPGMRKTLYFKDDDARLSFLQGNYITLTNMTQKDLERIALYKLSPINISVHTTNPELRCRMLNNRFAGDVLDKIRFLYEHDIVMNGQVVCCPGINDGEELKRTITDLAQFAPVMQSMSVVPVGLTKYREKLARLSLFDKKESEAVIDMIEKLQEEYLRTKGTRFVYASDEWYIKAERPFPEEEAYEGYKQIENGVGMCRSLKEEFIQELNLHEKNEKEHEISLATGVLAAPLMRELAVLAKEKYPNLKVNVYPIRNDFFGTDITVAGLITGQDLIAQLTGKNLGNYLLLPDVMLKNGEEVFLDDITLAQVKDALQIDIHIVQSNGMALLEEMVNNG